MGVKKKQREAEHRARKKAEGTLPRARPPAEPVEPDDWEVVRDLFVSEVNHPSSAYYDAGPGSFVLTAKGWMVVNPFSGIAHMTFEVPQARLVLEGLLSLARSVGHYNEMAEEALQKVRPPEDPKMWVGFGTPGRFKVAVMQQGGPPVGGLAERTVQTPWMPKDHVLFVGGHPEDLGRLAAFWDGEKWLYGALVWNPCVYLVALKADPRSNVLPWA